MGNKPQAALPLVAKSVLIVAGLLLSACQTTDDGANGPFVPEKGGTLFIAGARAGEGSGPSGEDVGKRVPGVLYNMFWTRYDLDKDRALFPYYRKDPFMHGIVHRERLARNCTKIDEWFYCVANVVPARYVLNSIDIFQTDGENRYSATRTSLGVRRTIFGIQASRHLPVSTSGSLRFRADPGKVYYLGDYTLSPYGQIMNLSFDDARAARALSRFGVRRPLQRTEFARPYRLQLRTGYCAALHVISGDEYSYENPCRQ